MPSRESEPIQRVCIWVYKSDWDYLDTYFKHKMPKSELTRKIVRKFRREVEESGNTPTHQHLRRRIVLPEPELDVMCEDETE